MRAITNMSKKLRAAGHCNRANIPGTLTNSALYNCMYVLRHICRQNPSCSGFGVDGVDDASRVLKDYKARVSRLDVDMTNRGYYVAILDLEKCFDSVDTAQLYDIVVELVSGKNCGRGTSCTDSATMDLESDEKSCLIHKYTVTHHITSAERFVARSIRHVTEGDDILSFQEASEELSQHYQDAVVTDGVVYSKLTREELLRVLRQHLFSHVVRMTSDTGEDILYNQVQGIPQGSVLSPLLCNIYYGRAECDVFGSENDARMLGLADGSSVIVRVVDDYIMVSLKRRCITYFLQRIYSCLGSYGGGVNMSKTRVNFDVSIEGHGERVVLSRADSDSMLWCGYDVNTKTLELSPSFSKIQNRPLEHTMNRECTQQGVALRKVMKSFLRPKLQPVILDAFMNSRETVVLSLYQLFSMTAKRAECYIRGKNKFCSISVARNPEFIVRCILEVVIYGANLVRRRSFRHRNRTLRLNSTYHEYKTKHSTNLCLPTTSGQCVVSKSEALWLGYQAFFDTLSKRRELYARVLDRLLRHLDSVRSNLPTSAVDEMKCSISKL